MLSKQNIPEKKEKVIEYIRRHGPSLPSPISNSIDLSLLFTSALLGEMYREGTLKMSYLKIGGSPLYLLPGQENSLDNFVHHLEKKEQEALNNLKKEGLLEDEKIEPSHRVALRNIRDFAIMTKVNIGEEEKIFWRIHTLNREEFEKKLGEFLKKKKIKTEIKKDGVEKIRGENPIEEKKEEKREEKKEIEKKDVEIKVKPKQRKNKKKEEIKQKISNYLESNNISLIKEIKEEDIFGIVSSKTSLGALNFLVIAKNKKKISDADITLALHEGQKNKMPVLFLTSGILTKKAQKYVEENKGYIIIKNVNL